MSDKMKKTMGAKLLKRMNVCDEMRGEAVEDLKTLRSEAISKHDQTSRAAAELAKKLDADPENETLQKEYAGAVNARKMFHHAAELNNALLESESAG